MSLAIAVINFVLGCPTRFSDSSPAITCGLKLAGRSNGRGGGGSCFLFETSNGPFNWATTDPGASCIIICINHSSYKTSTATNLWQLMHVLICMQGISHNNSCLYHQNFVFLTTAEVIQLHFTTNNNKGTLYEEWNFITLPVSSDSSLYLTYGIFSFRFWCLWGENNMYLFFY